MPPPRPADFTPLTAAGLNLQAVFHRAALPAELAAAMAALTSGLGWRQLILIGHGGRRLWQAVQEAAGEGGLDPDHPIDHFTRHAVARWFAAACPGCDSALLYPGEAPVGLQALGRLAGWHHPSPFMLGVRPGWGSWYAYRAVLLADSDFTATPPLPEAAPCTSCVERPCISACPAGAMAGGRFTLARCVAFRRRPDSPCRHTCLARLACPVGTEHRYGADQLRHTYGHSLAVIEDYCSGSPAPLSGPEAGSGAGLR